MRPTTPSYAIGLAALILLSAAPVSAKPGERGTAEAAASSRIEVRGEWIYVDGEPFLVKGIGYSPFRPGQVPWRDAVDAKLMDRDFARIAEAGFNTLRTWAPLSDEALALAASHGLMVLQGVWIERSGDFHSGAFRDSMLQVLRAEAARAAAHPNVLGLIVGNELHPAQVFAAGVPETEALLKQAAAAVKGVDATRLVSYANWPSLAFLDASPWDLVCFNVYPYEPASVAHAFGFRGYVEQLKRATAQHKPLLISELGLSLSHGSGTKPGYGGYTPQTRPPALLQLWDALFQAGAQGGAVFEWNDEWWKQAETNDDASTHDAEDPEEWFGLLEFQGPKDTIGKLRPDYEALRAYNQAILLSPVTGASYDDRIQVTVYATEEVAHVQFRLGSPNFLKPWIQATQLSRHWWKATLPVPPKLPAGEYPFVVEALDARSKRLNRLQRLVRIRQPLPVVKVSVATDRDLYEVGQAVESIHYTVTVTDPSGAPIAARPVYLAVTEPQTAMDITQTKLTDADGRVTGSYLVQQPGIIGLAAATLRNPSDPTLRTGDERFLVIRQQTEPRHVPSPWEDGIPAPLAEYLAHRPVAFRLTDTGTEDVIVYDQYGAFHGRGTPEYRYEITDIDGISAAAGEGIYPNEASLIRDSAFRAARDAGALAGSHWDFTFAKNAQHSFFKWASADEEPGVKQFYTALTLERAGLWRHAVKAYYSVLVNFPTSVGWTAFDPPTPWYVAKVARDKLFAILRLHPEIGLRLEGSVFEMDSGFDIDPANDVIRVDPGRLIRVQPDMVNLPSEDVTTLAVKRRVGQGRVQLVQYANRHWQMLVDGKPWIMRGMTYQPSAVGESPDEGSLKDWMQADRNGNGQIDAFDTFVDANRNDRQDADEPVVGDFALMRDAGVNTLRLYHHASNKELLRRLYQDYGIMVMLGDFVGMYTVGSGASWESGTDYLNTDQRKKMTDSVKAMVLEHKDEPYVLLWVLGNENNYGGVHGIIGGVGNAGQHPHEYYRFLNELATWIKSVDPNHPVAVANGDEGFLDVLASEAPAIDIFGANVYRGWHGFGRSLFEDAQRWLDKPVVITEYGCPAYQTGEPRDVAERDQALYHFGNWVDLADHLAGRGIGNALGGVVFEWNDEWWKAGQPPRFSPKVQETHPNWAGPYPGGWNFEEWYGLVSQGDGATSPYLRQLRMSYQMYKGVTERQRGGP